MLFVIWAVPFCSVVFVVWKRGSLFHLILKSARQGKPGELSVQRSIPWEIEEESPNRNHRCCPYPRWLYNLMRLFRVCMNKPYRCIKESRYKHTRMNVEENVSILHISKRLTCGEETLGWCLSTSLPYWGRRCVWSCTSRERRGERGESENNGSN